MSICGCVGEFLQYSARIAQNASNWCLDGPTRLFSRVNPLNDLMKLVEKVNDIAKPYIELAPLDHISKAVSKITDFVGARNFVTTMHDLVSGKAAWAHPFGRGVPDFLKVLSKLVYLVGNLATTTKWLAQIEVIGGELGKKILNSTAQIVSWGKEFNILKGVGDATCITGALLNLSDTCRLAIQELMTRGYVRNGFPNARLIANHVIDIAHDVTKIASAILSNIPGVHELFVLVSLAVGSGLSLGKFFINENWARPA